jgi:hypothetical protein
MAVKVLEMPKEPTHKVRCRECGALNGYERVDVREYHDRDISGGPDGREWISCGNCGKDITLKSW